MERFRASVEAARRGEEPPEDGYRGAYVAELAAAPGDPVPKMLARIEASLERFRIHFDSWALQSELETRLPEFLPRLDTYERDGAVWVRSGDHGDDKDQVVIRSAEKGGLPTYRAADIVYLADKLGRRYDRAIYVLGADHHGTRNWYAAIARMLGFDPEPRRGAALPVRPSRPWRRDDEDVETRRRRRHARRADRRGRRRRGALAPRQPRPRPDDRDRRRPGGREEPEESRLLRPVRARPDREHPAERRSGFAVRGAARRARSRGARPDQAARGVSRTSSRKRPPGAPRTRSRTTRSGSPTTSTASTTSTRCSAPRRRRSGSRLVMATRTVLARSLDLVGVEAPDRM